MLLRTLFDPATSTYTYLLGDEVTREAAIIDPVREQLERDMRAIDELGLKLLFVLETHVHANHVTSADLLRERTGAFAVGSTNGAPCADLHIDDREAVGIGRITISTLATPGHTRDSVSYFVDGHVFTGHTLLVGSTGRTDLLGSDAGELYDSITRLLFTLPDETLVHPSTGAPELGTSTIGEEKRNNPRLAGKSRDEFIAVMSALHLPRLANADEIRLANRRCGNVYSSSASAHSAPRSSPSR